MNSRSDIFLGRNLGQQLVKKVLFQCKCIHNAAIGKLTSYSLNRFTRLPQNWQNDKKVFKYFSQLVYPILLDHEIHQQIFQIHPTCLGYLKNPCFQAQKYKGFPKYIKGKFSPWYFQLLCY